MIRKAVLLILTLALMTAMVGCGMAAPALPPMGVGGADEMSGESMALPPLVPEAPAAEERQAVAMAAQDIVSERMIVRTGSLSIVVEDTEETLEAIERMASELGGYVSDLQSWRYDDQMAATVTVRILAASFDQARERIKELAIEVESENASGQDVTEEYVDLEARLNNLEVAEEELLELLASAQETHKDAESILAIYNEITNVRMQIEQIKGRMQYLENASELATLTITVTPEKIEEPVVEPGWEPLRQARDALRTLVNALKTLINLLIWVVLFFLPLAAILALPLILVWLVWYLRRRRRRRSKPE
jgi:enoyl-CoA hydratase/carnithine racemase